MLTLSKGASMRRTMVAVASVFSAAACQGEYGQVADDHSVRTGVPYEHALDIHCGVWGTTFDGSDWDAAEPIDDGSGNPRDDWRAEDERDGVASDIIPGTLTLVDAGTAEFRSDGGLTARFIRRPAPFPEDEVCE